MEITPDAVHSAILTHDADDIHKLAAHFGVPHTSATLRHAIADLAERRRIVEVGDRDGAKVFAALVDESPSVFNGGDPVRTYSDGSQTVGPYPKRRQEKDR